MSGLISVTGQPGEIPMRVGIPIGDLCAGFFHPTSIPTGVYKTSDGCMNIAVFGSTIWERFCHILGAPKWIADERYRDRQAR
ncbi:CoA transferase [Hydrogenophaga sp.]|uniref:CoA transferase n=1 Tax=Hydrogenophaga sp. TaxID=1904254 RepID=UPI002726A750|nr:CoA transferase [Hydrogenophaga sp.]MDO9434166.1 CoA transferase [Hydrogenophaga sp.]